MPYFQYHITYLRQGGVSEQPAVRELVQAADREEADRKLLAYERLEQAHPDFLIIVPKANGRDYYQYVGMTLTVEETEQQPQSVRPTG